MLSDLRRALRPPRHLPSDLPAILMVSKPVAPPWNDSSKNLVRDLALAGRRFCYHVLTPEAQTLDGEAVRCEPIYGTASGAHTPPLRQNLLVLARLLRPDSTALTHFFFAPNPRAAVAARFALRLRPRLTVQTVCSIPRDFSRPDGLLFAERVVVLSRYSRGRFLDAGVPAERLVLIPPAITIPSTPTAEERRDARRRHGLPLDAQVVLFPGDYQFSAAAGTFAQAIPALRDLEQTRFVFACRIKQAASLAEEARIRTLLHEARVLDRVRMLREVSDMEGLLAATDLVVLPADSLYAKMDLPLVLLEAMARQVPIVVAAEPPLDELLAGETGAGVAPRDARALAAAIRALLEDEGRRRALGENARRATLERYAIERVSALHEDLYQRLLDEQGAP
jgi:phosphatidylinositol alpha-1,6-mannosyltransferase